MSDELRLDDKPTVFFWVVGAAALIWNLIGFMVYYKQVTATPESLVAAYSPEQIAMINATPAWATSMTAIAVTAGVLGCLFLLLRKSWAVPALLLSLIAIVLQDAWIFGMTDSVSLFGKQVVIIQGLVLAIGVALLVYARRARAQDWLR